MAAAVSSRPPGSSARRYRRLGAAAVLFALPWMALALYALQAALPANPLALPAQHAVVLPVRQLLPEGWSFFTRDPREADVLIFHEDAAGGWRPAHLGSYAQAKYAFGWSRRPRAQGVELGLILARLTDADWRRCGKLDDCLAPSPAAEISLVNRSPVPTLCGHLALVSAKPVPWAWAHRLGQDHRPEAVVFVSSQC